MKLTALLTASFALIVGTRASPAGENDEGVNAPARAKRHLVLKVLDKNTGDVEWSPDGKTIAYCKRDTADWHMDIWTVRPDGTGHRKLNAGWDKKPGFPKKNVGCATWHPSGKYLAFVAANNDIRGKRPETLSHPGSGVNCNLWFMRADGSRVAQLTRYETSYTAPRGVIHVQFSKDGKKLAWTELLGRYPRTKCFEWGEWGVVVADFVIRDRQARVENLRRFRPGKLKSFYEAHQFSPDGKKLLLCGNTEEKQPLNGIDILEMDVETGKTRRLTRTLTDWDEHAHRSPDGKTIAWASGSGMNVKFPTLRCPDWKDYVKLDLWAMNSDGSNQRRITFFNQPGHPDHTWFTKGIYNSPRMVVADTDWSPDGKKMVATVAFEGPEKKLGSLLLMLDVASRLGSTR
jgi:Tol biopolymer transport system component